MFWRSRESAFVVFRQRPESRNRPSYKKGPQAERA
jgi:hypothetical protein